VYCVEHFLRLVAVWWPGTQSARDSHRVACNFDKYASIYEKFSLADSAINLFLVWLLTTPAHYFVH